MSPVVFFPYSTLKKGENNSGYLRSLVPQYGGPLLSHQNKMLTSNSNHSQQIQITHSKFKSLTANWKSLTANSNCSQKITNPPQQITNRSHQIQIVHIKYKSLTANTNTVSIKRWLPTADRGLQTADCGLRTADCGLQTRGKSRLRVKCRLQSKGKKQARG